MLESGDCKAEHTDAGYSLNAPESGEALVYSFIGYAEQEQPNDGRSVIDVTLAPDDKELEEVMVVAYGTAKKASFTGSATQVGADELQGNAKANPVAALSGRVAGVQITNDDGQPGSTPTIRIRGISSIYASNKPLYIVDGMPFEGNLSAINSQDIESMTVLKDAAASAIYGARGANGVIIITTKKANKGELKVNLDAKWGNNQRAVKNYEVITDPRQYHELQYRALYNYFALTRGDNSETAHNKANSNLFGVLGYQVFTIPDGQRIVGTNFKFNPEATLGYYDEEADSYYLPDDWYDEAFSKRNLRQEYNVSASGTTDRLSYYMSLGYLDDSGIVPSSGFRRYSARMKGDLDAKDWLRFSTNMSFTNYNRKSNDSNLNWGSSGNIFYAANMIAPIYPLYQRDKDGNIRYDAAGNIRYDFGSQRAFLSMSNPLGEQTLNDRNNRVDVFSGKWQADLMPIEGLTISAVLGVESTNSRFNALYTPLQSTSAAYDGSASVSHTREFGLTQQYLASYKRTFADVHGFDILAGYENYVYREHHLRGYNTYLYNPNVAELDNTVGEKPTVHSNSLSYQTRGFLARLQYDYAGKYFLSGSVRRDGSSVFDPDNRWGTFGSVGLAWLMSEEDFIKNLGWVDMLKAKFSYGVQGNDNLGRDDDDEVYRVWAFRPYQDLYKLTNSGDSSNPFALSFARKGNHDITWESSHSINAGIDFEVFKHLSGTFEFFKRKTSDMLYNMPVSSTKGYSTIPTNVGDMENTGFEFDLTGYIFRTPELEWSINVNGTHYKNEITDLSEDVRENGIKNSATIYRIGGSVYNSYLVRSAGIDHETGVELYYAKDDDGNWEVSTEYNANSREDLGTTLPKIYGGFGTTVLWRGIDFSAQFSYQLGGKIYDGSYEELMHSGQSSTAGTNWHKDILNAWTPENPNTDIPRLNYGDDRRQHTQDKYLISSNFISFNTLVLGYTFKEELINKLKLQKVRVYFSADNIAMKSKRQGLDPRQRMAAGGSTTSGNFSYSALRNISGGLQITF